ncbi:MAG TPA: MFS transporter [Chthoniobacter sp.]|nr:MFS transporter [Chthoniobacter sp.]
MFPPRPFGAIKAAASTASPEDAASSIAGEVTGARQAPPPRVGRYRWVICALLFFATTINYIDRQVFGILAPEMKKIFGWTDANYTDIVFWFEAAYAIGQLGVGRVLDWIGTRVGFAIAMIFWSVASMLHAGMATIAGFSVARFLLGLGESGNFPASIKTVAEWFPKKERALATGIFNAGSNVGAIAAPLSIPWIYLTWGWQWAFVITGSIGFVWLMFWLRAFRAPEAHPRLSADELAYIRSDAVDTTVEKVPWLRLLPHRQTWAYVVAKFLTDSVWRWYLYLLPLFFASQFKLDIKSFGPPFVLIYCLADLGSIAGGWASSQLIARGWSVNAGRKTAMLVCAVCVVPVVLVTQVANMWLAVWLVGLAAAAHQGWSANLYTTASDMFPKQAVGSIVGIGGMAGALGAMGLLKLTGAILNASGNYTLLFIIAGSAYLLALAAMHLLVPRLAQAELQVS